MSYAIKEKRKALGLTQEELSEKAGVPRQTISSLESGAQTNTTTATLSKIAAALECKITDIFLS